MRLKRTKEPVIRDLEDGLVVIDWGPVWYVCKDDGEVTKKYCHGHRVISRPATPKECMVAWGYAAFGQ